MKLISNNKYTKKLYNFEAISYKFLPYFLYFLPQPHCRAPREKHRPAAYRCGLIPVTVWSDWMNWASRSFKLSSSILAGLAGSKTTGSK